MKNLAVSRALLLGVSGLAFAAPAYAQDAAAQDDANVIVVTAQNRAQSVNDVPIAIDVVGAEQLKEAGFANMNDIDKIAPVVQLNQDQGTVKVSIRGVGTTSNDEAQDTSVVVNIDGEYMNRPNAMGVALFDMDRVEVLRGPQGTLYGRNSTGGAINFITRKPGREFGANASASYGNYNAIRADAGLDLPLGEVGGLRVAGFFEDRDGYVSHPAHPSVTLPGPNAAFGPTPTFAGGRSDDNRSYGGRASLRFDGGERLTVNLAAEYAKREFTPQVFAYASLNANPVPGGGGPVAPYGLGPTGPGCNAGGFDRVATAYTQTLCVPANTNFISLVDPSSYAAPLFGLGKINQRTYALRGRIAYEISDAATLTYTGGYRNFDQGGSKLPLPVTYQNFTFLDIAKTQSHELRLNGELGGGIIYQVGAFYFKETLDREGGFFLPFGGGTYFSYFGRNISSDSRSAFAQVDLPVTDTITLVGGLRYTDSDREAFFLNAAAGARFNYNADGTLASVVRGSPFTNTALSGRGPGRKDLLNIFGQRLTLDPAKEDKITWLAGINIKPNTDTLIFAKVSTGFKAGGFDSIGAYKAETNTAFEAGWKQSFGPSGQHQFNLGAFHYDYKDLQVSVLLDTTVGGQTFNAGSAKIWGFEAEANIELDDNDSFHASFNYLNAEYKELFAQFNVFTVAGTGADLNGIGDLDPNTAGIQQPNFAGNRPPFSPEFIITAGYQHVFGLGSAGSITAKADTLLKSRYFTTFFNHRDGMQKALTQTDLSLEFKPESEKFFIQAFVRNLEDTRALTYGSFVSAGPDDIFNWQYGTPRTYGVRFGFDF